jgi:hypothetical protein
VRVVSWLDILIGVLKCLRQPSGDRSHKLSLEWSSLVDVPDSGVLFNSPWPGLAVPIFVQSASAVVYAGGSCCEKDLV